MTKEGLQLLIIKTPQIFFDMAPKSKKYSKNHLQCMHVISIVVRFIMTVYAMNKHQEQGYIKVHNE